MVSVTNPTDEYEALLHVVERVSGRFPLMAEHTLVDLVAEEVSQFDHVRFRAFIPVLVEGNVLRTLRESADDSSREPDGR